MKTSLSLWSLVILYAAARPLQGFPDSVPMVTIVALHGLPPLVLALIHGAAAYRLRGILAFMLLCFIVGNFTENLSILSGFPFGRYHFTDVMGPKLFHVPILLGLAYIGMGYLSWMLARLSWKIPDGRSLSLPPASWLPGIFPWSRFGQTLCTAGSGTMAVPTSACP